MELKIWRHFIEILSYREDLITVIKPFMENLNNNNINNEKYIPFLKLFQTHQLELLHKLEIINEENYNTLVPNKPSESLGEHQQQILDIIKHDNLNGLKEFIREKGIELVNRITIPFNEFHKVKIPIIQMCLIEKATLCFKYLLINNLDSPEETMEEITQKPFFSNKSIKKYDWDCMTTAIYYGEIEKISILEELGIQKGSKSSHLEAAILSFRNTLAKSIIKSIPEGNESFIGNAIFASARSNNIKGYEILLANGGKINYQILFF